MLNGPRNAWLGNAARLALVAAAASCSHSKTVEDTGPRGATSDPRGHPEVAPSPEHPLVVDAPAKLLRPGAGHRIQEALRKKGLMLRVEDAELGELTVDTIADFQREHHLAATGFPDARTLALLDLDPEQIYRSPPQPGEIERQTRKQASEARAAEASKKS